MASDAWHCWCCGALVVAEGESYDEATTYMCAECGETQQGDELIPASVMASSPCDVPED